MEKNNSLGQRIAKTDAQIAAFWRWFGKSKAVDKQGRPLVLYHGVERAPSFESFRFDPSITGALGPGIYLTSDLKIANEYTGAPWKRETERQRIYPVYARILNPFVESRDQNMWDTFNPNKERIDDIVVHRRMKDAGYDGVIGIGGTPNVASRKGFIDVVVFDPRQIKSALGNRGTFDPEDPVITNPPPLDFPAELIIDPFLPVPPKFGRKKTKHLAELREAYQYSMRKRFDRKKIYGPEDTASLLAPLMSSLSYEQMVVLAMDPHMRVIGEPLIASKGAVDGTECDVRTILRSVLLANGVSLIVAHNHPSGDVEPSPADRAVTKRLVAAGRAIDLPLQDHLVIGKEGTFTSLRRSCPECWST